MIIASMRYFIIAILIFRSANWAFDYFGLSCFEQLIYHLKVPLKGTNTTFLFDWIKSCGLPGVLVGALCAFVYGSIHFPGLWFAKGILYLSIIYGLFHIGFFGFVLNLFRTSQLYERYFADPVNVKPIPPAKPKNLIHIYLESMETTYANKADGGDSVENLIPTLTRLAKNHVSFSNTEALGGNAVLSGTGWTTGGIVASESGAPLLFPLTQPFIRKNTSFCPGLTSLGDLLYSQGYQQVYMIGSDSDFGGRDSYYRQHGNFEIIDTKWIKAHGKLPKNYHKFWGFEDDKLFSFAKDEICKLAKDDKPFHLSLLTVDTHHPRGYQGPSTQAVSKHGLSNSIHHTDVLIADFIDWLKSMPFYEDTVVVIQGDHTSMAAEYIRKNYDSDYDRRVYNCFIHAQGIQDVKDPVFKNRKFTTFDYFPTILHALGWTIPGNHLGLGTDLFSGASTVAETIGYKRFDKALRKQSKYYKDRILKS